MHDIKINGSEVVYKCDGLLYRDDIELSVISGRYEIRCKNCNKELIKIREICNREYRIEYVVLD